MDYISVVISSFWLIMEQMATIAAPVLGIILVFRLIRGILFNAR